MIVGVGALLACLHVRLHSLHLRYKVDESPGGGKAQYLGDGVPEGEGQVQVARVAEAVRVEIDDAHEHALLPEEDVGVALARAGTRTK